MIGRHGDIDFVGRAWLGFVSGCWRLPLLEEAVMTVIEKWQLYCEAALLVEEPQAEALLAFAEALEEVRRL